MNALSTYRERLGGLPESAFFGSVCWFSITGTVDRTDGTRKTIATRVARDLMAVWFSDLGLDDAYLPKAPKAVDVFRKATSKLKAEYIPDSKHMGTRSVLRVVEVEKTDTYVLRHVMRDVIDAKDHLHTSAHVATLKYFHPSRILRRQGYTGSYKAAILDQVVEVGLDGKTTGRQFPLPTVDRTHLEEALADVQTRYDLDLNHLDSDSIRAILRNYLVDLKAIPLKAGLYFLPTFHQDTLESLRELVGRIGQGCTLDELPLIDTPDKRAMVVDAFHTDVQSRLNALMADIATVNETALKSGGGVIPPRDYQRISAGYADVLSRLEEHAKLIASTGRRSDSALDMVSASLTGMAKRVGTGRRPAR